MNDYQFLLQTDIDSMLKSSPYLRAYHQEDHDKYERFLFTSMEHLLFCMDMVTAYKYLIQVQTDWDYRYFARKIYLLMHKSQKMFDNHNKWMHEAKKYLVPKDYQELEKVRKLFTAFYKKYDESDLEPVRNKVEAHRDKLIHVQIQAVHKLSVKRSAMIIQESFDMVTEHAQHLIPLILKMTINIHAVGIITPAD